VRKLEESGTLRSHRPRFDPTVIPLATLDSNQTTIAAEPDSVKTSTSKKFYSSADYIAAYKSGAVTPTQVAERLLESLKKDDKHLILIAPRPREELLAAAAESTKRYASGTPLLLDGVPLIVKDELDVAGFPKTLGLSPQEAALRKVGVREKGKTSWCVQKLFDAGMLFVGKSNMHELGMDTTNNNPNWGTPPNPYNRKYYPGGSSGGSAAAVGSGLVPIAVGADGGGSIRVPATYCGIYGLKPSHGRVSAAPTPNFAPSVGVPGPMAATMADLELSYRLMATPDTSSNSASAHFPPSGAGPGPTKKVLGIYTPWFEDCEPAVAKHTQAGLSRLRSLGYEVVEISLPFLSESRCAHAMTILNEVGADFCGCNTHGLTAPSKVLVAVSARTSARDFVIAQKLRALLMSHLAYLFQKHPGLIILSPTVPIVGVEILKGVAEKGSRGVSDANTSMRSMQYVYIANWAGCPAITVPCGYDGDTNMPIGLMGMADWGADDDLIAFGKEWERSWDGEDAGKKRGVGWVDILGTGQ
jgi:Asp-tRNA(Asn)/Glu-tRNA(Gln) amidotransferase A subunit family amidase